MHAATRERPLAAQQRQKQCADQGRRDIDYAVGDQVLPSPRLIKLQAPCGGTATLMPRWTGLLWTVEKVGKVAHRLDLPANPKRLHPVFHVTAADDTSRPLCQLKLKVALRTLWNVC